MVYVEFRIPQIGGMNVRPVGDAASIEDAHSLIEADRTAPKQELRGTTGPGKYYLFELIETHPEQAN